MSFTDAINKEKSGNQREYWEIYSDAVLKDFLDEVREQGKKDYGAVAADIVQQYYDNVSGGMTPKKAWKDAREQTFNDFDQVDLKHLRQTLNKVKATAGQLMRAARKNARSLAMDVQGDLAADDNTIKPTAEDFRYAIGKAVGLVSSRTAPGENVSAEERVKKLKDAIGSLVTTFAMTSHPTNPTSKEFTKAIANYERGMEAVTEDGTPDVAARKAAMQALVTVMNDPKVNLVAAKKTPADEMEELESVMESLYDAIPQVYRDLKNAIRSEMERVQDEDGKRVYDEAQIQEVIESIPARMVEANAWFVGDGDGNANQTPETLRDGVERLKKGIERKYQQTMAVISDKIPDGYMEAGNLKQELAKIKDEVMRGDLSSVGTINGIANDVRAEGFEGLAGELEDLAVRFNAFGDFYARFEVRHNAEDLAQVLAGVAASMVVDDANGQMQSVLKAYENFAQYLGNDDLSEKVQEQKNKAKDDLFNAAAVVLKNKSPEVIAQAVSDNLARVGNDGNDIHTGLREVTARIFGRLQEMGKNPNAFADMIIAEASTATDAKMAMTLLKAAGNEIPAKDGKRALNIVPLFEDRDDLKGAAGAMADMLKDKDFMQNVRENGSLNVMIAKSDTTRRAGSFAMVEQWKTVGMVSLLSATKEMEGIPVSVYHGGGDALQRGGGKISEIPYVQAKAIMRMYDQKGDLRERYKEEFEEKTGLTLDKTNLDKLYANAKESVARFRTTIQGHQVGLSFNGADDGKSTIRGWLAQILNQTLKFTGLFKGNEVLEKGVQERIEKENGWDGLSKEEQKTKIEEFKGEIDKLEDKVYVREEKAAAVAMDFYQNKVFSNKGALNAALRELSDFVPSELISLGNVSSRGAVRGGDAAQAADAANETEWTVQKLADNVKDDLFKQRAIGTDKTSIHSGTGFSATMSVSEGLLSIMNDGNTTNFFDDVVNKEGGFELSDDNIKKLREQFKYSKAMRDLMRNQANSLMKKDFGLAWDFLLDDKDKKDGAARPLRGSEEFQGLLKIYEKIYNAPDAKEANAIMDRIKSETEDEKIIAKAQLAFLEEQSHFIAKAIHAAVIKTKLPDVDESKGVPAQMQEEWKNNGIKVGEMSKQQKIDQMLKEPMREIWPQMYKESEFRDNFAATEKEESVRVTKELKAVLGDYRDLKKLEAALEKAGKQNASVVDKNEALLQRLVPDFDDKKPEELREAVTAAKLKAGSKPVDDKLIEDARVIYTANDVTNNPISMGTSLTKQDRDAGNVEANDAKNKINQEAIGRVQGIFTDMVEYLGKRISGVGRAGMSAA